VSKTALVLSTNDPGTTEMHQMAAFEGFFLTHNAPLYSKNLAGNIGRIFISSCKNC
jgi:hypothetical protein